MHKHEEISKYFLCIFRNEIPPIANIKLSLLFTYNNFLQYSTKNTNFVLVKILFYEEKKQQPEMIYRIHIKLGTAQKILFGIFIYLGTRFYAVYRFCFSVFNINIHHFTSFFIKKYRTGLSDV